VTPAARAFWLLAQRRVAGLQPDVAAALFRAFSIIRDALTDAQIQAAIDAGGIDVLFSRALNQSVLDQAFIPVRQRLRQTVERGFKYAVPDLPKGGKINGVLGVSFDYLNPNVITAVRNLETSTLETLSTDTRAVVKQAAEVALQEGVGLKALGRRIRDAVGLAPAHEQYVRNYEDELRGGDPAALDRKLRDKRFDGATRKAIDGEGLSEAQITARVDAYRRKWVDHNANTIARTTTLQSYKAGQELTWKQARENGVVPSNARLMKMWVQVQRPTKREAHIPLNGETVPIDQPYSNGEMVPGESTFNCACVSRITVEKSAA
jgi:hypothetical protein